MSVIWLYISYNKMFPSFGSIEEKCVRHLALYKKKVSVIWLYIIKCFLHLAHLALYNHLALYKKIVRHLALYNEMFPSFKKKVSSIEEKVSVIWLYIRKCVRHLALIEEKVSAIWLYIRKSVRHLALYKKKVSVIWLYIRNIVRHLALYNKMFPSFGSIEEKVSVIRLYIRKGCPSFCCI